MSRPKTSQPSTSLTRRMAAQAKRLYDTSPVQISERRTLKVGDEVKISGERGTFTFLRTYLPDGSLTFYGGVKGSEQFRSFTIERVRKIGRCKTAPSRPEPTPADPDALPVDDAKPTYDNDVTDAQVREAIYRNNAGEKLSTIHKDLGVSYAVLRRKVRDAQAATATAAA